MSGDRALVRGLQLRALEGAGLVQVFHPAEGPDNGPHLADDVLLRHGAATGEVLVEAGVLAVGPVVAHHPEPALGDGDFERAVGGRRALGDVRLLVEWDAVHRDPTLVVAALDAVAADADHALHEVATGRVE